MSSKPMIDKILENYPDQTFLKAEGFDSAILGVEPKTMVIVYSCKGCMDVLLEQGLDYISATEFFEFSVRNVDFGSKTPLFLEDNFD